MFTSRAFLLQFQLVKPDLLHLLELSVIVLASIDVHVFNIVLPVEI